MAFGLATQFVVMFVVFHATIMLFGYCVFANDRSFFTPISSMSTLSLWHHVILRCCATAVMMHLYWCGLFLYGMVYFLNFLVLEIALARVKGLSCHMHTFWMFDECVELSGEVAMFHTVALFPGLLLAYHTTSNSWARPFCTVAWVWGIMLTWELTSFAIGWQYGRTDYPVPHHYAIASGFCVSVPLSASISLELSLVIQRLTCRGGRLFLGERIKVLVRAVIVMGLVGASMVYRPRMSYPCWMFLGIASFLDFTYGDPLADTIPLSRVLQLLIPTLQMPIASALDNLLVDNLILHVDWSLCVLCVMSTCIGVVLWSFKPLPPTRGSYALLFGSGLLFNMHCVVHAWLATQGFADIRCPESCGDGFLGAYKCGLCRTEFPIEWRNQTAFALFIIFLLYQSAIGCAVFRYGTFGGSKLNN